MLGYWDSNTRSPKQPSVSLPPSPSPNLLALYYGSVSVDSLAARWRRPAAGRRTELRQRNIQPRDEQRRDGRARPLRNDLRTVLVDNVLVPGHEDVLRLFGQRHFPPLVEPSADELRVIVGQLVQPSEVWNVVIAAVGAAASTEEDGPIVAVRVAILSGGKRRRVSCGETVQCNQTPLNHPPPTTLINQFSTLGNLSPD